MNRGEKIRNILSQLNPMVKENREDFLREVDRAYGEGRDDHRKAFYEGRENENKDTDAIRLSTTLGTNPTVTRFNENIGTANPKHRMAREDLGLGAPKTLAGKLGQMVGTIGNDLTQDHSRGIWWLLNAPQASANVLAEIGLKVANPDLYGASIVKDKAGRSFTKNNSPKNKRAIKEGILNKDGKRQVGYGYTTEKWVDSEGREQERDVYSKRNYRPGTVEALSIPTGIAINSGLGLLTPFGGAEGYEAALPSQEDPTKTANVIAEVAAKYFLGRTGDLLPYDEFVKVRPDVTPGEYRAYKAFKYDKNIDINPFDDGDITLPFGIAKATSDGIHGAEVQFLGRSLPVNTGLVPYALAAAGGMVGARRGRANGSAVKQSFIGGMAGLAAGQIGGHLLEAERRRRNTVENQLENPQY